MGLEEVARQTRALSGSPDTGTFPKIFKLQYLLNEKGHLAENADFISGEQETRGGDTTWLAVLVHQSNFQQDIPFRSRDIFFVKLFEKPLYQERT